MVEAYYVPEKEIDGGIDKKKLKEEYPEVYKKVCKDPNDRLSTVRICLRKNRKGMWR